MPSSFVIILHTGLGPDHYDLMLEMLEAGESLATWQLQADCLALRPGDSLAARKLPDHRRAYLSYQGPVSGGLGHVSRVHAGTYETLDRGPDRLVVRLDSPNASAEFELTRSANPGQADDWHITRLPPKEGPRS
jgi:hypothetical protein